MNLILDEETFPERTLPAVPLFQVDPNRFAQYADKAEQQYLYEGGVRVTMLQAAVVTAERTPPKRSMYYMEPTNSFPETWMERIHAHDVLVLLGLVPGVRVHRDYSRPGAPFSIVIRGESSIRPGPPLLLIDDMITDLEVLTMLDPQRVARIDVLKDADAAIFGSRGMFGVICIFTKDLDPVKITSVPFHIRSVLPLSHQQPVEFYAPKYETEFQRNVPNPDLRTTIHWQPVVEINSQGEASFEFYTADVSTSYTVIIEGVANNGQIIRQEGKIWRSGER